MWCSVSASRYARGEGIADFRVVGDVVAEDARAGKLWNSASVEPPGARRRRSRSRSEQVQDELGAATAAVSKASVGDDMELLAVDGVLPASVAEAPRGAAQVMAERTANNLALSDEVDGVVGAEAA